MKKTSLLFGAIGLLFAGNAFGSFTGTVTLTTNSKTGHGHDYGGGAFYAQTSANGNFETFCIDVGHEFTPGNTYNYKISQNTNPNGNKANYISIGTAFLYSSFLDVMDNNPASWTSSQSTVLQNTLWALEGEISGSGILYNFKNGYDTEFYDALMGEFGSIADAKKDAGADNIYGVAVMNLYDGKEAAKNLAQSQLIRIKCPPVVSVPEPSTIVAGALLLLPLGVSALKVLRRKQQATVS